MHCNYLNSCPHRQASNFTLHISHNEYANLVKPQSLFHWYTQPYPVVQPAEVNAVIHIIDTYIISCYLLEKVNQQSADDHRNSSHSTLWVNCCEIWPVFKLSLDHKSHFHKRKPTKCTVKEGKSKLLSAHNNTFYFCCHCNCMVPCHIFTSIHNMSTFMECILLLIGMSKTVLFTF